MKKAVISLLLVLPFILIVIISFAARIVSNYRFINVESVCFINEMEECFDSSHIVKIEIGESLDLNYKILPELSSNKRISFTSTDENIVTINEKGVIYGVSNGIATVVATTQDGFKKAMIQINVTDDFVRSVSLSHNELNLKIKQIFELKSFIYPSSAIDKRVVYVSSDPSVVSVSQNGVLNAKKAGFATITVTTRDGDFSSVCEVTVEDEIDFGFVDYEEEHDLYFVSELEIDLLDLIIYNDSIIEKENIVFEIISGQGATLNGSTLILPTNKVILVRARVVNTPYISEIYLRYKNN